MSPGSLGDPNQFINCKKPGKSSPSSGTSENCAVLGERQENLQDTGTKRMIDPELKGSKSQGLHESERLEMS